MPAPSPTNTEAQIAWLTDRAQIHDLLLAYARCLDTRNWRACAGLLVDDGRVLWPHGSITKDQLAASVETILEPFERTHHVYTNISIEIDGDTARTNHYLQSTHIKSANAPSKHADVGGWYDNLCRRTQDGWRLEQIDLTFVWSAGDVFEPGIPEIS